MKQNGKHLKVVVALLLAVMMLFGVLAVTASAADAGEKTVTEYDTPWYTITYTALHGTERAKVDVRIKTEYSKYLDIRKEDLAELKRETLDILYHLAIDSLLAQSEAEAQQEQASDNTRSMRQRLNAGDLNIDIDDDLDLSHIDITRFENFIRSHLTSDEAKEKVEAILNSEFDTVIQLVVDKYVTEQGYAYEDIEAKVNIIIVDLIPEIYADEPEKIIEMEETITGKITEVVEEAKEIKESGEEIELSLSDLKSIRALTVNGESVFSDGSFRVDAIKALIADLPRPSEIKDFDDTEMLLN